MYHVEEVFIIGLIKDGINLLMRQDEPVMRLCGVHLIITIQLKAIMASSSVVFSYFGNVDLLLSPSVIHSHYENRAASCHSL